MEPMNTGTPETIDGIDGMEPCVPLATTEEAPIGHPSGLNRAQRREAYARHKATDRARRLAAQRRG